MSSDANTAQTSKVEVRKVTLNMFDINLSACGISKKNLHPVASSVQRIRFVNSTQTTVDASGILRVVVDCGKRSRDEVSTLLDAVIDTTLGIIAHKLDMQADGMA